MTHHLPYNEKDLLLQVSDGDEAAFEQIFHLYLPRLTPFAFKLTQDWEVAREMVQETFLRIWLSRDQLVHVINPSAYFFTIAANQCYKYLKRKVLHDNLPDAEDAAADPHAAIHLHDLQRLIGQAVDSLPAQRRRIFIMSREKGMTIPEIAGALNLSPSTVKNTLVTALNTVRDYLKSQGYLLPAILILSVILKK